MRTLCFPCCLLLAIACSEGREENPVEPQPAPADTREGRRHLRLCLKMSSDALERSEFDLATAHAQKALEIDPDSARACELILLAALRRMGGDDRERRANFNAEWREIMKRLECDVFRVHDVLDYPEDRDEVAQK